MLYLQRIFYIAKLLCMTNTFENRMTFGSAKVYVSGMGMMDLPLTSLGNSLKEVRISSPLPPKPLC